MEIKQALEQLQKHPETFEDIRKETEARFRELVEAWMQRRSTFQTTLGAMQAFNNVFDRLDAARKRELSKNASKNGADFGQLGNVAALREALKRIVAASIVAKNANAPEWILQRMADIFEMATTALAAPARNCDTISGRDPYKHQSKWCKAVARSVNPDQYCMNMSCVQCLFTWLVATAQEGAAK